MDSWWQKRHNSVVIGGKGKREIGLSSGSPLTDGAIPETKEEKG